MSRPPKKWARTAATARARYRFDDHEVLDGLDMEFLDAQGVVLRVIRLSYREPHAPALSDVMTDLAQTAERRARMHVDPTSYRLVDGATTVSVNMVGGSV